MVEGEAEQQHTLVIFISTCAVNAQRRRCIRRSWFTYKHAADSPLAAEQRDAVHMVFVASESEQGTVLSDEAVQERDVVFVDAPEGYGHLWRKALVFLRALVHASDPQALAGLGPPPAAHHHNSSHALSGDAPGGEATVAAWWQRQQLERSCKTSGLRRAGVSYVMHADDDSYVRLDLLLPIMRAWPRQRHYWGYIWDGTANRCTAPIRNPANKSHMPVEQYALDYYPPFASGCGFVLSWDLVVTLARAEPTLPEYRLLDPPFGIHLCGPPGLCLLDEPVVTVHDDRVRPYRPLPMFRPDTLVQHYMKPEEMAPFHAMARSSAQPRSAGSSGGGELSDRGGEGSGNVPAEQLYNQLVAMGLLRR